MDEPAFSSVNRLTDGPDVDRITGGRRLRRNRRFDWQRRLVQENVLTASDLILPLFIIDGDNREEEIEAMPGVSRYTLDLAVEKVKRAASLGIPVVAPFPNVELNLRDQTGSEIVNPDNIINRFTRIVKDAVIDIGVMTDAALDPFTDHGHDGILRSGIIVNDESVDQIAKAAVLQADAGADIIAPSDMMDGRIGAIREALNDADHPDVAIMSYTAKYASAFYGPYREAIGTDKTLQGDKRTYYVDPANTDDAMREAETDIDEGADMLMVKPGMPYLDVLWRMKDTFQMPTYVYQVSGEYSMMMAAAANGWIDGERAKMEALMAFKRAGADGIFCYYAMDVAEKLAATR